MDSTPKPAATEKPIRIQRKRTKGSKLPPNTICVSRPSIFGNPFTISFCQEWFACSRKEAIKHSVDLYRRWVTGNLESGWTHALPPTREEIEELRGQNVACWCRLDQPCHRDVLLELANTTATQE